LAEQYRLQGILLLAQQHAATPEAETALQQALNIARHQGAKSLHLRTALNLAQLWQRQGKLAQARDVLSSLYNGFTEGANTPDLQAARRFLVGL
jgi:predicted ATPase